MLKNIGFIFKKGLQQRGPIIYDSCVSIIEENIGFLFLIQAIYVFKNK